MALPPKGDPRRPLHLAIRSSRVLAILLLLFGSCAFLPMFISRGTARGPNIFVGVSVLMCYLGPGAAYLVFSIYMKERRFWAVLATLILASIHVLFVILGAVGMAIFFMTQSGKTPGVSTTFMLFPLAIFAFLILALGQLIYHLALSFEAIKYAPIEEQAGFEPVMAKPARRD